jgi:hypothetical protein
MVAAKKHVVPDSQQSGISHSLAAYCGSGSPYFWDASAISLLDLLPRFGSGRLGSVWSWLRTNLSIASFDVYRRPQTRTVSRVVPLDPFRAQRSIAGREHRTGKKPQAAVNETSDSPSSSGASTITFDAITFSFQVKVC